jgi:hypothetical protein
LSKKRKKKQPGLSSEAREQVERVVSQILGDLPTSDPVAVFDAAVASAPDLGAEIIERLAKTRNQEVLDFLCGISRSMSDKAQQKSIRKAIYSLEQSGLQVSENARPKGAPVIKAPEKKIAQGFLGAYDVDGVRMGVLALPAEPTGYELGVFLCDQKTGLRDFSAWRTSAGDFRKAIDNLSRNSPTPLIEVPPEAVRFVLAEAAETAQADGRTAGDDYIGFVLAANRVEKPSRPMAYNVVTTGPEAEDAEAVTLWDHAFLQNLFIREELFPYLAKLEESETSVLVLTPAQEEERRQSLLDEAREEIFSSERRTILRRQLEETALLLWQVGISGVAAAALDAAAKVEESPAGDPVIAELFRRSIEEAMGREGLSTLNESPDDSDPGGSGLIVPGRF